MVGIAALVLWQNQRRASITSSVEHSDDVILRAKDAQIVLHGMQLALRGYLLSRQERYLSELSDDQHEFTNNLGKIAALVADNPEQEQRLFEISDLKGTWTKSVDRSIGRKEGEQFDADFSDVQAQADALFGSLEDFINDEYQLRAQRKASRAHQTQIASVLVSLFTVVVMAFLSYWGWHQIQLASDQFHQALIGADDARATAEKSRARAEKASRAKDDFLGTVSHELRNPLNSIMLWSSTLLLKQGLDEHSRRGLGAIERAARVQGQLVEDLLDVSRIESGRLRLDVQTVDLADVVRAGVESMRTAAEAKSIALQEIIDPRIDFIAGDPARLQQIVWNLVSNAVKFTPSGGRIQVRVERINSHVEIVVADTGEGIEPSSLRFVFDRFWQAEAPGRSTQGVGLGLSIVKQIVALHGGTVAAHSDGPGRGTTFTVRLPLPIGKTPSLELRRHPTVSQASNAASAPRLDGFLILVVDDDVDACDALKGLLRSLGAGVAAANSVQDAMRLLDELHPNAVVSDIGMPVHDGYFLARELRKREHAGGNNQRLPLVALTAYGRVEDKIQVLAAGFDSHTIKPVDAAELSAILCSLIAAHTAQD
jgi:signal transduction histidine kinase/ActR/RegA family two-component response regulator